MSMSDDPRNRRGQNGNQRQPAPQGREGRTERPAAPQRGYSQPDAAAERNSERQPSFSAYRPEAYANGDKRSPRQDWDDGRAAPRPQSPAAEAYPRPAPERPAPQLDPRDPYRSGAPDPYAAPQRDHEAEWRPPYQDSNSFQDAGSKFANYYDEPPQVSDAQAVHDRFFAADPEPASAHYRGKDYSDPQFDAGQTNNGFGGQGDGGFAGQPAQRAAFAGDHDYTWENYEEAPPPASVRPYQAQAAGRDDDMDADFFADEDEFDNEDYQEEKRSGRKKLMAAVLVGAVVSGLGLGFLYKNSNRSDGSEPATVVADARPVKETPRTPGGKQFPGGNKLIQDRLGGGAGESDAGTALASAEPAGGSAQEDSPGVVTTTGGGTLEDRIKNALRDAKKPDPAGADANPVDVPQTVKTVKVNPDGSFAEAAGGGSRARSVTPPKAETRTAPPPVETKAAEEDAPETTATPPAAGRRVAALASQTQPVVTESTGGSGNFFVQVGARNVQEDAMKAFAVMQQKYASVLGNYQPSVRKVDLAEKGIWYRLRVGPFTSKDDAEKLCNDLKTAGWKQCFSVKD